jgi:putative flippase GtrA
MKIIMRYGLSGLLTTGIDYLVYFSLIGLTTSFIAKTISISFAICISYFLNKYFTFKNITRINYTELVVFLLIQVINISINVTSNELFLIFLQNKTCAFLFSVSLSSLVNFFLLNILFKDVKNV